MGKKTGKLAAWSTSMLWGGPVAMKALVEGKNPGKEIDKTADSFGEQTDEAIPRMPDMSPDLPEQPPVPPSMTNPETESTRSGAARRLSKRRTLGGIYMTKGSRGTSTGLGGSNQILG